ncbi:MAG: hypothetical protein H7834_07905 [Magnetococcus sp. YQC-9]
MSDSQTTPTEEPVDTLDAKPPPSSTTDPPQSPREVPSVNPDGTAPLAGCDAIAVLPDQQGREILYQFGDAQMNPEMESLKDEVDSILITLRSLFTNPQDPWFQNYFGTLLTQARLGLTGEKPRPAMAKRTLAMLKNEIMAQGANSLRIRYLKNLGMHVIAQALLLIVFIVIPIYTYHWHNDANIPAAAQAETQTQAKPQDETRDKAQDAGQKSDKKTTPNADKKSAKVLIDIDSRIGPFLSKEILNCCTLWIGCCIGVWLSVCMNPPVSRFESLQLMARDNLEPSIRLIFTGLLSIFLALLLNSQIIVIKLGSFDVNYFLFDFKESLIIGMFCGLGEKALSTTVSQRVSQFMEGIK